MRRPSEDPRQAAERRTNSLAALAATLCLIVAGLYLVHRLRAEAALQDCVLSGRSGCMMAAR